MRAAACMPEPARLSLKKRPEKQTLLREAEERIFMMKYAKYAAACIADFQ